MTSGFSEKEQNLISEFRKLIEEPLLEDDFERTDDYLLTWLQYANYDVKKAEQALRNNKKWRRENNLDQILLEDMKDMNEECPLELNPGVDKFGCPILLARADWDIKRIITGSPNGKDRFVRYMTKTCEQNSKMLKHHYFRTVGRVSRFICVVDVGGFCYQQLIYPKVISALTEVVKVAENYYPGIVKTTYFLNVPKAFKYLLDIMKPFLSGDTISRIKLFDSNKSKWKEGMLDDFSEEQLPSFLQTQEDVN